MGYLIVTRDFSDVLIISNLHKHSFSFNHLIYSLFDI
jgi:hypothetical protein